MFALIVQRAILRYDAQFFYRAIFNLIFFAFRMIVWESTSGN